MSKKRKPSEEMHREYGFESPNSKKTKKAEDMMMLGESVSGVSRSGRVRKKSAKLMEMEDFDSPENDPTDSADRSGKHQKKAKFGITATSTPIGLLNSPTIEGELEDDDFGAEEDHPMLSVTISRSTTESHKASSKKNKLKDASSSRICPIKIEKSFLGDTDHSGSEMSSPKHHSSSSKKKKKKSKNEHSRHHSGSSSLSTLDLLAAGGLSSSPPPPTQHKSKNKNKKKSKNVSKHLSHSSSMMMSPLMEDDSPDVDVGEHELADSSELVIAEPILPKISSGSSKKKKKKSSHEGGKIRVKLEPDDDFDDMDSNNTVASSTSLSHSHSVYLAEKKKVKKQKISSAGKIIGRKERKKGRPMTAYTLWCREYRPWVVAESPDMDFAAISRRLGEVWQSLPDKEKLSWRRQAKRLSAKNAVNPTNKINSESQPKSKVINKQTKTVFSESESSPHIRDLYKVVGIAPIDVAAHLKLLGESLSIIGQRLTEHEGQIAVSGSLSVLLDSTLCALGPLLCLSAEIPEFEGCSHETLGSILDNIAYIMPGL